jgi:DNA-directed RNA polymerase specialized sigma subunit
MMQMPIHSVTGYPQPTALSERLIRDNMALARSRAQRYASKTGQPYDDLESIAYMGLVRGCRAYDPARINPGTGRAYALSTIAVPFIDGAILHHFRDHGYAVKLPLAWREKWSKLQSMIDAGADPVAIAEATGLPPEEQVEAVAAMRGTVELNDEIEGGSVETEVDILSDLRSLTTRAWRNMRAADQKLVEKWYDSPARTQFPHGPLQQFQVRFRRLLNGATLQVHRQLALVVVPTVTPEPKPKRQRRQRDMGGVVQGGLKIGRV